MKAMVLNQVGEPLNLQDISKPVPSEGEVILHLRAAALNHRDVFITQGLYPGIQTPAVLGSDGVGDFEGRRVLILPGLNWGDDERVQAASYQVLGMPTNGTFAEQIAVPKENIYDCPEHLTDAEAAALPLAGLTAYRALFNRANAKAGETVVVTGAGGGVAAFAIQFAVEAGCRVIATSSNPSKIAYAKTLGAQTCINYHDDDWIDQLKKATGGIDVVIDGAGGQGFAALSKLMNPAGRMAFYGGTTGKIPDLSPQLLFWRQITIAGSTMGSPKEFAEMLDFVSKYKIRPVVDSIRPLERIGEAMEKMKAGQQQGKLVVSI